MNGKEIASVLRKEAELIRKTPYPGPLAADMHNIRFTLLSLAEEFEAYEEKPTPV